MKTRKSLALLLILALMAGFGTSQVLADSAMVDFEGYLLGSVHGQDGWSMTGPYDVAVVANTYGYTSFGSQSLRMSNAVTSGSFGDWAFSKSLADEAGETSAAGDGQSGGTRQSFFEARWDIASTVPGAEQPGLQISAAPDRGDGARMSFLRFNDTSTGLKVTFADYQQSINDFVITEIATGLDRSAPHNIRLQMYFLDGPANDVVNVYIDDTLVHTGTSWEDYFRDVEGNPTRTVDSMLFQARSGAGTAPATSGYGFLIDNLTLFSGAGPQCSFTDSGTTRTLNGDCVTDHTILIPDGWTLDGDGHTITAIDPVGGHFLGAVVRNAGATAYVSNLTVTAGALLNVCDGGDDRLRGIMFEGASGAITHATVVEINQGNSGCQEGNAIEIRNAPFDGTHPNTQFVQISNSYIDDYQKTGIVANGDVNVSITNNFVGSADLDDFIAANSIQLGYGASGSANSNTIQGNDWDGSSDYAATAVLVYAAGNVNINSNEIGGVGTDVGVYALFSGTVNIMNNTITRDPDDATKDDYGVGVWFYGNSGKSKLVHNTFSGWNDSYFGADLDKVNVDQP